MNLFRFLINDSSSSQASSSSEGGASFLQQVWENIKQWCTTKGLAFLIALLVLIIVIILINILAKAIRKWLRKNPKTEGVANAIYSTVRTILNILAIMTFMGYIGVDMAGLSSIIASCAVAIGLALQGSLSNIAGWVIIVVTRPFKLGDFITAQGESGTVEEINLFYTHLKTPDNKIVYIPNGTLSGGVITNVSIKDSRRLDEVFTISYNDDPNKAIEVIQRVIAKEMLVLRSPEPFVKVSNYADSAVEITVRVWVKSEDYWTLHWDLLADVRKAFDENDIEIPFNQYDVNINAFPGKEASKKAKKKEIGEITTSEEKLEQAILSPKEDAIIPEYLTGSKARKTKKKSKKEAK